MLSPLLANQFLLAFHDDSGFAVLGIFAIVYFYIHQRNRMNHETIRRMIDSGQPVTPETIASLKSAGGSWSWGGNWGASMQGANSSRKAQRDLRNGILLTCIGAGLIMFIGGPGWIVLAVGVAHLLLAFFDNSKDPDPTIFSTPFKGGVPPVPPMPTPAAPPFPPAPPIPPAPSSPFAPTPAETFAPPPQPPTPPGYPQHPQQ